MAKRDYYAVLGVSRSATPDEIRTAYRRLARKYHPDVNKSPDAAERFKEVQEAYDALSDAQKRKQYDQFGYAGPAAGAEARPGGGMHYTWTTGRGGAAPDIDLEDLSSMFETFFGGREGMGGFGARAGPFGGAKTAGRRTRAGRREPESPVEVHHDLHVDFVKAALGGVETLRIERDGRTSTIDVTIPRGVQEGARLRVKGGAGATPAGVPRDLILTVRVRPHALLRRGDAEVPGGSPSDLYLTLPLTIAEASLGARVRVPTLVGAVELTVPPGTASGSKLRLRGRGIDDGKTRGDLYAIVRIVPPDGRALTDEERQWVRRLAARTPDPRTGPEWTAGATGPAPP